MHFTHRWRAIFLIASCVGVGGCRSHRTRSTRPAASSAPAPDAAASVVPPLLFEALSAVAHDRATSDEEQLVRDSFAWDLQAAMTAIEAVQGNAAPDAAAVLDTTQKEIATGQVPTNEEMKALAERMAVSIQAGEVCAASDAEGADLAELEKAAALPPLPASATAGERAFYAPFAVRAKKLEAYASVLCDRAIPHAGFARDAQTKKWVVLRKPINPSRRPR